MDDRKVLATWIAFLATLAAGCGDGSSADDAFDASDDAEVDAGADADADGDADADADALAASLTLTYADPCPCFPPPCCPQITLTFSAGSAAAWYLMCGDAVACAPPPVGWERQLAGGGWERVVTPGESSTAGFQCAPDTWTDLGMYSIPEPPSGTVRAVGLFDDECGADLATCATRCNAAYEVVSNAVSIP